MPTAASGGVIGTRSTRHLSRKHRGRVLRMSSPLTLKDVERIAALAHLDLTRDEKQLFTRQLAQILEYAERLQEVDTTDVSAAWQPVSEPAPLRPDEPRESLSNEAALDNAPAPGPGGLFRVPRVIG